MISSVGLGNGNGYESVVQSSGGEDSQVQAIRQEIASLQKEIQEVNQEKDLTDQEKSKQKQELQREIAELNQQLNQRQNEMRKVESQGVVLEVEDVEDVEEVQNSDLDEGREEVEKGKVEDMERGEVPSMTKDRLGEIKEMLSAEGDKTRSKIQ